MKPTHFQHLTCSDDTSGNPRRVFVFYDSTGAIVAAHDEGYAGRPKECLGLVELPDIETYPAVRRALLKEFPRLKEDEV